MRNCTDCKYAEWYRTTAGKLHPSGDGQCTYKVQIPVLPQALYWISKPSVSFGCINRRRELKDHCACFVRRY